MPYHVHIITVGFDPEPSMDAVGSGIPADKAYLFTDRSDERAVDSENAIVHCLDAGNIEHEIVDLDCYDFSKIYNEVLIVADKERAEHNDVRFHINFSRGTAIAVSAVCCAAYELNSDLYYVKYKSGERFLPIEERVLRIDIDNIYRRIELTERTKDCLLAFDSDSDQTNAQLKKKMNLKSDGTLKRYTSELQKKGLISPVSISGTIHWSLTPSGRNQVRRLRNLN